MCWKYWYFMSLEFMKPFECCIVVCWNIYKLVSANRWDVLLNVYCLLINTKQYSVLCKLQSTKCMAAVVEKPNNPKFKSLSGIFNRKDQSVILFWSHKSDVEWHTCLKVFTQRWIISSFSNNQYSEYRPFLWRYFPQKSWLQSLKHLLHGSRP